MNDASFPSRLFTTQRDGETIQTGLSLWEIGGIIVVWSLIAGTTMVEQLTCDCSHGMHHTRMAGLITSLSSYHLVWMIMTIPIFLGCSWFHPKRIGWLRGIAGHLLLAFVILVGVRLGANALATGLLPFTAPDYRFGRTLDPTVIVAELKFLSGFASYTLLLLAGFGRDAYLRYKARREQAERLEHEANQLRAQLTSAQLEALRMQLNPHFLFNTLHMVSTMAGENPAGVRTSIAHLSDMLRYALSTSDRPEVELDEEIRVLESYLTIQRLRMGHRLHTEVDVDDNARDALVPTLLLQPLAENAMKYAFEDRTDRGHLFVRARRVGDDVEIVVEDDGPGLPGTPVDADRVGGDGCPVPTGDGAAPTSHGIGLPNLEKRLDGMYGPDGSLSLETSDAGGLRVVIRLPYHTGTASSDLRVTAVAG